jgi:beta-galactosidase
LQWFVPYAPGTLSAKGYKDGKVIAETKVETTGEPSAIVLTPDRVTINADGEDCSVVTVAVTDAQGRIIPAAENLVHFQITGPGKIIGVGNGDPSCHEADVCPDDPKRSVFNGLAQVIVQAGKDAGNIQLTASSDGLAGTTLTIHADAHPARAALP